MADAAPWVFIGTEKLVDHPVGVGSIGHRHLFDGSREPRLAGKDVGVLGEEAEDEPSHEVIHFMPAFRSLPPEILLQKLDIESIPADPSP